MKELKKPEWVAIKYTQQEIEEAIDYLYSIFPKKDGKLKTLKEYNDSKNKIGGLGSPLGDPKPIGVACPQCGEELVNPTPNLVLASYPGQINTFCPKCKYQGYARA